jgi:hypothetical protein
VKGANDTVFSVLSSDLSQVLYSTYFGGSGNYARGNAIDVNASGKVVFTFTDDSTDLPILKSPWPNYQGPGGAYAVFSPQTLPIQDDFNNGTAPYFVPQSGNWTLTGGRYNVAQPAVLGDALSTLQLAGALPAAKLEINVLVNATAPVGGQYSNGFVIFNYLGPTNFMYAGLRAAAHQWVIGHRVASGGNYGWVDDYIVSDASAVPGKDFKLQVILNGATVSLSVNGVLKASWTYAGTVENGQIGIGTHRAAAQFDNFSVGQPPSVVTAASASPTSVSLAAGGTTNLSALGADSYFAESGLTYTWSWAGPAPVAFSSNGSNAAKNTKATFTQAGTYTLRVTITDLDGLTVTSDVLITVI